MTTFRDADFHLTRPGALIAALPALLGFVPESSLVVVTLAYGELGSVARVDLQTLSRDQLRALARTVAGGGADAVIAVFVDEAWRDHADAADDLADALEEQEVELWATHVVDSVAVGGRWRCVDGCGRGGAVDDPSASPLAAAAVLDGRQLYRRRSDLVRLIEIVDEERAAALGEVLAAWRGTDPHPDPDDATRADAEFAVAAAVALGEGRQPSDVAVTRLTTAMADARVRDMLYALAVSVLASEAESLWLVMARALPEPWRAEALALLAFSAYVRGDGPLAGICLEAALQANPTHTMAGMLDEALHRGMRPDQIRELGHSGFRVAATLGVALPPRRSIGTVRPSRP
jgi:hypothetical protein